MSREEKRALQEEEKLREAEKAEKAIMLKNKQ